MSPLDALEKQNEIIRIQSGVIDDLFRMLLQHISAAEADKLPVLKRMNLAATLRAEIKEGGYE